MKCEYCGFEREDLFAFCPQCGRQVQDAQLAVQEEKPNFILQALKDKLFLVVCLLVTAMAATELLGGELPLINGFFAVYLWIVYANAQKDIFDAKALRGVSGTIYALYVIYYVLAGLLIVCGVIFAAAFSAVANEPDFYPVMMAEFADVEAEVAEFLIPMIMNAGGIIFMVVFLIICAILILSNVFGLRFLHRLAKSAYQSGGVEKAALKHVGAAKIVLYVAAVYSIVSALGSLSGGETLSGLYGACDGAAMIISAILIGKYLEEK